MPPDLAATSEGNSNGLAFWKNFTEDAPEFIHDGKVTYSNPLPSVLMLTAIVVGIATTALALALIVRIREDYGTIEEDEILAIDLAEGDRPTGHSGKVAT